MKNLERKKFLKIILETFFVVSEKNQQICQIQRPINLRKFVNESKEVPEN